MTDREIAEFTQNYTSAKTARSLSENANNQVIHPTVVKQLKFIENAINEATADGKFFIEIKNELPQETKNFLEKKGYTITENRMQALTSYDNRGTVVSTKISF